MSTATNETIGSWQPDPWERHELRWRDGEVWTDAVIDHGHQSRDAEIAAPTPATATESAPEPAMATPTLPPAPPPTRPIPPVEVAQSARLDEPLNPSLVPVSRQRPHKRSSGGRFVRTILVFGMGVAVGVYAAPTVREWWEDRNAAEVVTADATPALVGAEATHAEAFIESAEFGEAWPLTVGSGTVLCEMVPGPVPVAHIFFVVPEGTVYAVNGIAAGGIEQQGWRQLEEIWRTDPAIPGARMDISPVRERGQAICEPPAVAAAADAAVVAGQ